jgi:uncharacterized protein HemX
MTLQLGGGLLAGAAAIGAGYYAWHEHENKKTEEEVSFLPHYSDFFLNLPSSKETSPHVGCARMAD